jgi:hypothetical protein
MSNVREQALDLLTQLRSNCRAKHDDSNYYIGYLESMIATLATKEEMIASNSILNELTESVDWTMPS